MAYGKRDGISYLDGVPVKISESVRAPRKVILPVHFHPSIPTDLLTEEYDFSMERRVVADAEQRKQTMERLQKAEVEKVASDIEYFTQTNMLNENHSAELSESFIERVKDEENVADERRFAFRPSLRCAGILTPQPLASRNSAKIDPDLQPKSLNLADFENETSPFDYMELQTINDLEELSNVFGGLAGNDPHDTRRVPRSHEHSAVSVPGNSLHEQHSDGGSAVVDVQNAKVSFSSPAYFSVLDRADFANGPKGDLPYLSNGYSFQPKVLYNLARSAETNVADYGSHEFQKMRSAKSFSDIPSALEGATSDNNVRSHTPPPAPYFSVTRKSNGSFDHEPSCNPSASISSLQKDNLDPFVELKPEEQTLVSGIADMGFSRGRVARAVNHLGTDDKKVIDYLCLVQNLEDAGYDGYETELALQLHNYNTNEAKSFLDLLQQFQDLGFDKDLARNALVHHKNDRDKALDSLLT